MAITQLVKETLLNDNWWMNVDYIHAFTTPIYDVLRKNKYKYDYSSLSLSI